MDNTNKSEPAIGGKAVIVIAVLVSIASALAICWTLSKGADVDPADYPRSRYARDDAGGVWFLRPGDGYQRVEGADADSFEPLPANASGPIEYSGLARDRDHLYAMGQRMPGVAPDGVHYLESRYYVAGDQAYYGATLLEGADADRLRVFQNAPRYPNEYAHDDRRLYFQGRWIQGADIASLAKVPREAPTPAERGYLKDRHRVYYRDRVVVGANADSFALVAVPGLIVDRSHHAFYGHDGRHYFLRDQALPERVAGTEQALPPGGLELLLADRDLGWHFLFYQGRQLFYHQPFTNELEPLCRRDSGAPLEQLGRGLYRDDRHLYYAWTALDHRKGRYASGLRGWYTGLEVVPGVHPDEWRLIGERRLHMPGKTLTGNLYQADERRFLNPAEGYVAGLWGVNGDGQLQRLDRENECLAYTRNPDWNYVPARARAILILLAIVLTVIGGIRWLLRRKATGTKGGHQ
ncbi:hypothetical protein A6D6_03605 [Alcanivorax xiamenensis]|uniref:DKNYY family protein n=1 Tax=Alcanivorax xiamenensis TaxID=1177156 RepID=A0ABQ6Y3W0_9GAMM|nr:DKNYY domain-containing protein [Alcanivorax xiamenensis]KAF0803759.1 hypothetical protein A6D6_03605 [Alcanivorax xiamenensis]